MVAHGALGQVQRLRDLAVVEPLGDELGDIALALCEPLGEGGGGLAVIGVRQRVVEGGSGAVCWPLPDERAHAVGDIGSQDDLAFHDGMQRFGQTTSFLLDEVAAGPDRQRAHDVVVVGEGGEENDARLRVGGEDGLAGGQARQVGHADVEEHDVGVVLVEKRRRLGPLRAEGRHAHATARLQYRAQRLGHELVVVHDDDGKGRWGAHGRTSWVLGKVAKTREPARGGGNGPNEKVPPKAVARSSIEARPRPPSPTRFAARPLSSMAS